MPAVSENQRITSCIALNIKLGKQPKKYSPQAAKMAKTMKLEDLKDMCHSKVKE